jgi:hypothetical protein
MPKFGAHIIIAELAGQKRPDVFNAPHSNAFRLGAVGSDTTLFMFDPATDNPGIGSSHPTGYLKSNGSDHRLRPGTARI